MRASLSHRELVRPGSGDFRCFSTLGFCSVVHGAANIGRLNSDRGIVKYRSAAR